MPKRLPEPCKNPVCSNLVVGGGYCEECEAKHLHENAITIVWGPPGSGKSTHVYRNMNPGDLVIDLDLIWQALTALGRNNRPDSVKPYVFIVRDALYAELAKRTNNTPVWVIAGLPRRLDRERLQRRFRAKMIRMDVSREECLARIAKDGKREGKSMGDYWTPMVDRWFKEYQP